MAPIKQEEQMKDKLEKRSLQPSAASWSTLANRLDVEQKNKRTSLYWWFGIAASIVGFVFVTSFYFNNLENDSPLPVIVNTSEEVIKERDIDNIEKATSIEIVAVEKEVLKENVSNKNEAISNEKILIPQTKKIIQKQTVERVVIAQVETIKDQANPVNINKDTDQIFEAQKVQDVVAQINMLKSNGKDISDAEIDNLLKNAQKEILSNRIFNNTIRTFDANALLQDVEADLQQSFRSKVLEALQSGYESVKTAVAERNN